MSRGFLPGKMGSVFIFSEGSTPEHKAGLPRPVGDLSQPDNLPVMGNAVKDVGNVTETVGEISDQTNLPASRPPGPGK